MQDDERRSRARAATARNVAVGAASVETVGRFGSANAEYVKAYTGIDNELGKVLDRGLRKISRYTVNPQYAGQNLRQQAGYAAEVHRVAASNAENIIQRRPVRIVRTDDVPALFGKNNPVFDTVALDANGKVIAGSGAQLKVCTDLESLLQKIARGEGGGKTDLSRYLGVKLELPTEQVERARQICLKKAASLRTQAAAVEQRGDPVRAARLRKHADNYEKLSGNIQDAGLTAADAMFYREHPELATIRDITVTSHRAGIAGAQIGFVVGGATNIFVNLVAVANDEKEVRDAVCDVAVGTAKAVAVGYGTGFAGSAVKGLMQQSSSATLRTISATAFPAMAVAICLELGNAVSMYVRGEIDGTEFLETLGEKGSGMLASGWGATLGQIAIPIPVVGGLIGGMVGYTLSSMLYRDALLAFQGAKHAREEFLRIQAICTEARECMESYRVQFKAEFSEWLCQGRAELASRIDRMDAAVEAGDISSFAASANSLAEYMGQSLLFRSRVEFDSFMGSDLELAL
jgi:hypothetical protein